jgi:hypothetical protein
LLAARRARREVNVDVDEERAEDGVTTAVIAADVG